MKNNYSSSSIFSLKGNDLDDRYNRRIKIYEDALVDIKSNLNEVIINAAKSELVTVDSLHEWILQELIKDYRNI